MQAYERRMESQPKCPKCKSESVYPDGALWICPECAHEWTLHENKKEESAAEQVVGVRDAHGNFLKDGDSVTIIKDLKVKGSSSVIKVGTKIKNIRVIDAEDGHNISCKIDGFGQMNLKSEFIKKSL
ncbi:MAG: phnA [Bacteriovoracaceae bacterium]|nr:phnA [Bacteriovoracaceae bacterium]